MVVRLDQEFSYIIFVSQSYALHVETQVVELPQNHLSAEVVFYDPEQQLFYWDKLFYLGV